MNNTTTSAVGANANASNLTDIRKKSLKQQSVAEARAATFNASKIQESWLRIMRAAKTKQLLGEVEIVAQSQERALDRKDLAMQMCDKELEEAEEQHQVAIRTILAHFQTLETLYKGKVEALCAEFASQAASLDEEFDAERSQLDGKHALARKELQNIIAQAEADEKVIEQADITEHQSQYELIRNRNIEEDHQMRSTLEEKIEQLKEKCNAQLTSYRQSTETNTADYKSYLARDAALSRHVERKLRQVERMQADISHWRSKAQQNKNEWEERNSQLRGERDQIQKHLSDLKMRMNRQRVEEGQRLVDLTNNADECKKTLGEELDLAEKVLKLQELARKLETEREKVTPFYVNQDVSVDDLPFDDEELKDEVRDALKDTGVDEWTYLNNFSKRLNKVRLDKLAIEKEKQKLDNENMQLRSILKQFLEGVTVTERVLDEPNPLLVVNGKVKLNQTLAATRKLASSPQVVIEAAMITK